MGAALTSDLFGTHYLGRPRFANTDGQIAMSARALEHGTFCDHGLDDSADRLKHVDYSFRFAASCAKLRRIDERRTSRSTNIASFRNA
jgi:hypothetical protein